jgi:hypothetical protein
MVTSYLDAAERAAISIDANEIYESNQSDANAAPPRPLRPRRSARAKVAECDEPDRAVVESCPMAISNISSTF